MQIISIAASKTAADLGVTPETVTKWLWDEFHNQEGDHTLIDELGDDIVVEGATNPVCPRPRRSERSWKRHRRTQYRG